MLSPSCMEKLLTFDITNFSSKLFYNCYASKLHLSLPLAVTSTIAEISQGGLKAEKVFFTSLHIS